MRPGRALCAAIERPDLAADPALATAAGRREAEDRLEAAIAAWTRQRSPDEAMEALQAGASRPAWRAASTSCMLYEPHLMARGYWQDVPRRTSNGPCSPRRPSARTASPIRSAPRRPTLGQSTREVLSRILGLDDAEIDRLEAAASSARRPIPMAERRPRSSALLHEAAAGGGD